MVLNGVYLVDDGDEPGFRKVVEVLAAELARQGIAVELTGSVAAVQLRQGLDRGGAMTKPSRSAEAERRRAIAAAKREQAIERSRRRHEQAAKERADRSSAGDDGARPMRRAGGPTSPASGASARSRWSTSSTACSTGAWSIHGDITLAVADVDLVYVGLRALIASVGCGRAAPRIGATGEDR